MRSNIEQQIGQFVDKWPNAEFGPAHIVLSDYNLADGHVTWCITLISGCLSGDLAPKDSKGGNIDIEHYRGKHSREELIDTLAFLAELLRTPEEVRDFSATETQEDSLT